MAIFGIFSLVILGISLLLVIGSVVGLILLWYFTLRRPRSGMPACGKCGYAVRGASTLSCAECGADLRRVGITQPAKRQTVHPALFIVGWCLLLPIPAMIVSGVVIGFGPQQASTNLTVNLTPSTSGTSGTSGNATPAPYQVDITAHWAHAAGGHAGISSNSNFSSQQGAGPHTVSFSPPQGRKPTDLTLTISPASASGAASVNVGPGPTPPAATAQATPSGGATITAYVDPATLRLVNVAGAAPTSASGKLDTAGVEQMLATVSSSTSGNPAMHDQAREIAGFVKSVTSGGTSYTFNHFDTSTSNWTMRTPAIWFAWLQLGLWGVIWLAGLVFYLRLRRRRRARVAQTMTLDAEPDAPASADPTPPAQPAQTPPVEPIASSSPSYPPQS